MARLDWLTASPIAHRGLHERALGVIENTPTAVAAAMAEGYAAEIDVQISADGEAVAFRETADRIFTLDECLDIVEGKQPLLVEIKAGARADDRLAARVAERLVLRGGPAAAKSFNPRVVGALRRLAPGVPRGIVGEAFADDDPHWATLSPRRRFAARHLLHWPMTRPDFLSWNVYDLERPTVRLVRALGRPVMTWTVRTVEDQAHAALFADQMVFEGFRP